MSRPLLKNLKNNWKKRIKKQMKRMKNEANFIKSKKY